MPTRSRRALLVAALWLVFAAPAVAQQEDPDPPSTAERLAHQESAARHDGLSPAEVETPPLPAGMTLDEVLGRAAGPPPESWPDVVPDDRSYLFTFIEQLEWRIADDQSPGNLGWEAQGWFGSDLDKLWWKSEGETVFEGSDRGESETDLLYSRLVSPFWSFQAGVQYANEWHGGDYGDRVSGVLAVQGLAPYKFEVDGSLYVSEDGDVTFALEAEYDLRITQRLVAQPRLETMVAAGKITGRELGAGFTDVTLDLRLRYEIRRELAPYLGIRYQSLLGGTRDLAEAADEQADELQYLVGVRFAF